MNASIAYNKLLQFAPKVVSQQEFETILKEEATPSNPVKVWWKKEDGSITSHQMYWIDGPIGDGIAGGTDTKELEDMYNVPVVDADGSWRTLTMDTIEKFRFNNKTYKIR